MKKTNKLNISLLLGLASVFFLMTIGIVSAELVTPATSGTVTGTATFNVTNASLTTSLAEMYNCTIWASSSLTANSTNVSVGTVTNSSAGNVSAYGTLSTIVLEDANNYVMYALCANLTAQANSTLNTGITVNNTVPALPTARSATVTDQSIDFSATVNGTEVTSCTLDFDGINFGGASQTMTHSGSTCTLTLNNVPEQSYRWYVTSSDESETTPDQVTTTSVDVTTGAGKSMTPEQIAQAEKEIKTLGGTQSPINRNLILFIVGIFVVIGLIRVFRE